MSRFRSIVCDAKFQSPPLRFEQALLPQGLVFYGFTTFDSEAFDPIGLKLA